MKDCVYLPRYCAKETEALFVCSKILWRACFLLLLPPFSGYPVFCPFALFFVFFNLFHHMTKSSLFSKRSLSRSFVVCVHVISYLHLIFERRSVCTEEDKAWTVFDRGMSFVHCFLCLLHSQWTCVVFAPACNFCRVLAKRRANCYCIDKVELDCGLSHAPAAELARHIRRETRAHADLALLQSCKLPAQ